MFTICWQIRKLSQYSRNLSLYRSIYSFYTGEDEIYKAIRIGYTNDFIKCNLNVSKAITYETSSNRKSIYYLTDLMLKFKYRDELKMKITVDKFRFLVKLQLEC